jgi:predicted dehydrogenase
VGQPHRIGIVGLGTISAQYLTTFSRMSGIAITAVADLDAARAGDAARLLPSARALSTAELVADPEVDVVLNLTIPAAHADVSHAAIAAGKRVYTEKPITVDLAEGVEVMRAAENAGVVVGCAPDTVLGTGTQTGRAAIADGAIGTPTAALAVMVTPGHERWHPNPDFYYREGGGPLLDMGPYYVSSLIHLLGPIRSVVGMSSRPRLQRTIGTGPRSGERVPVEVDTHVTGVFEHVSGALSTLVTTFEGSRTSAAPIEVHGDEGTLLVPDPNTFGGEVRVARTGDDDWRTIEPSAGYVDTGRGIGVLDLVTARADRLPRADGALALHALDAMTALLAAARDGSRVTLSTTASVPDIVPLTPTAEWAELA